MAKRKIEDPSSEAASSSDKRPRPGGCRQKQRWAEADARNASNSFSNPGSKSVLASLLLSMWCWGVLSTPTVQKIASAALADGASHPEVRNLATLGSSGQYPNHMYNQLMSKLSLPSISGALDQMWVFLKKRSKIIKAKHVIMLPHVLVSKLYHEHKHIFMDSILGGDAKLSHDFGMRWKNLNIPVMMTTRLRRGRITKLMASRCYCIAMVSQSAGSNVRGQRAWESGAGHHIWDKAVRFSRIFWYTWFMMSWLLRTIAAVWLGFSKNYFGHCIGCRWANIRMRIAQAENSHLRTQSISWKTRTLLTDILWSFGQNVQTSRRWLNSMNFQEWRKEHHADVVRPTQARLHGPIIAFMRPSGWKPYGRKNNGWGRIRTLTLCSMAVFQDLESYFGVLTQCTQNI